MIGLSDKADRGDGLDGHIGLARGQTVRALRPLLQEAQVRVFFHGGSARSEIQQEMNSLIYQQL